MTYRDGIATITLNRPDRLNAMNQAMFTGMAQAFLRVAGDTSIKVAILTGIGRAFSAGLDLHERQESGARGLGYPDTSPLVNRPEAMNALDPEHNDALADAFARYEADDSLRAAVLTGAGPVSFSAGADLRRLIPPFRDAVRTGESPPWVMGGITGDADTGKPKIAVVNGHALAGGLELALACDFRLCSANATFGLAETKWAIIPRAGGTQRLPRAVPLGPALEMIMSGEPSAPRTRCAEASSTACWPPPT